MVFTPSPATALRYLAITCSASGNTSGCLGADGAACFSRCSFRIAAVSSRVLFHSAEAVLGCRLPSWQV